MIFLNDGEVAPIRPVRNVLLGVSLALLSLPIPVPTAAQVTDTASFSTTNADWDGLSELTRLASEESINIRQMSDLDVSLLGPGDSLLVLNPNANLPAESLTSFVRNGGRVALADDFGSGTNLFEVFQITKRPLEAGEVPNLRSDPSLAFAIAGASHALNSEVQGLVTNHATSLSHASLTPLFRFGQDGPALVFAGVVGDGRFVAVGDPSLFINNMMALSGNRRFAINLMRYLTDGGTGTIWLVSPMTQIGEDALLPPMDFEAWLSTLAATRPSDRVIYILSILLATLCIILVVGTASRPEEASALTPQSVNRSASGGTRQPKQLYHPLMSYRDEFLAKLASHLGIRSTAQIPAFVERMHAQGTPKATCNEFRKFANSLEKLSRREAAPGKATVGKIEFLRYLRQGEGLVRSITEEVE